MYEIDQGRWFVLNPINNFTVSPRKKLIYRAEGSLTLYFQNESPRGEKEANWLPAPKGRLAAWVDLNPRHYIGEWPRFALSGRDRSRR